MTEFTPIKIEDKGVIKFLLEHGATEQQTKSKAVSMIVDGMTDEEITTSATARAEMNKLQRQSEKLTAKIDSIEERYSHVSEMLEEAELYAAENTISNPGVLDGVNAYKRMLEAVRDVFGHSNMSEAVICASIEAASYGCWRSIMGPKTEGEAKRRSDKETRWL